MNELLNICKDVLIGALPLSALAGFVWWKVTHSRKYTEGDNR